MRISTAMFSCANRAVGSTVPSDGQTQKRSSMSEHVNLAVNQNKGQLPKTHLDRVAPANRVKHSKAGPMEAQDCYGGTG